MPTVLGIYNETLNILGEPLTESIDSEKKWIKRIRAAYRPTLDNLLEDYGWDFATVLTCLDAPLATEDKEWPYVFGKPVDWYKTLKVNDCPNFDSEGIRYDDRTGHLLACEPVIYLWYVSSNYAEQTGGWSQKFADLLSVEIADRIYPTTDESDGTRDRIEKLLKRRRRDAKVHNSNNETHTRRRETSWQRARRTPRYGSGKGYGKYSIDDSCATVQTVEVNEINLAELDLNTLDPC